MNIHLGEQGPEGTKILGLDILLATIIKDHLDHLDHQENRV